MTTCAICLKKFKQGDNIRTHDSNATGDTVAHPFHEECLREWYKTRETCPTCRDRIDWDDWIIVEM